MASKQGSVGWGRRAGWLVVAAVSVVGCGPARGTVSGKVTFRNQPLTSGTVQFFGADNSVTSGLLDANGCYRVVNLPPGRARVTVVGHPRVPAGLLRANRAAPPAARAPKVSLSASDLDRRHPRIPDKYACPERSELTVAVGRGEQAFDIDLRTDKSR